jgi:hypothetical protein
MSVLPDARYDGDSRRHLRALQLSHRWQGRNFVCFFFVPLVLVFPFLLSFLPLFYMVVSSQPLFVFTVDTYSTTWSCK